MEKTTCLCCLWVCDACQVLYYYAVNNEHRRNYCSEKWVEQSLAFAGVFILEELCLSWNYGAQSSKIDIYLNYIQQDRQCPYDVTLQLIHATVMAVEKQ